MIKYRLLNEDGSWTETTILSEAQVHSNYIEVAEEVEEVVEIPQIISRMRFWLSVYEILNLTKENVIDMVMQLADSSDKVKILIMLNEAQEFDRTNPVLNAMVELFGISSQILDQIFINANNY